MILPAQPERRRVPPRAGVRRQTRLGRRGRQYQGRHHNLRQPAPREIAARNRDSAARRRYHRGSLSARLRGGRARHARVRNPGAVRIHVPAPQRALGLPLHRGLRQQRDHAALRIQQGHDEGRRSSADGRRRRVRPVQRGCHAHHPGQRQVQQGTGRHLPAGLGGTAGRVRHGQARTRHERHARFHTGRRAARCSSRVSSNSA